MVHSWLSPFLVFVFGLVFLVRLGFVVMASRAGLSSVRQQKEQSRQGPRGLRITRRIPTVVPHAAQLSIGSSLEKNAPPRLAAGD
jgi:hypothetical protein